MDLYRTMVGKLRLVDMFCVALTAEWQCLKLIASCRLIFKVCVIYQCAYTNS